MSQVPTVIIRPEAQQIDLVFILDTICSRHTFKQRRQYVLNLIDEVTGSVHGGRLRFGAIAYGASQLTPRDPITFAGSPLSDNVEKVRKFLGSRKAERGRDFESAFEDALEMLYRFDWGRANRRYVIAVGNRPPHPYIREPGCMGQLASPSMYDWRVLLTGLRTYFRLNFISVMCPIYWPGSNLPEYAEAYASSCWREVGYTASVKFDPANFGAVARIITGPPAGPAREALGPS